MAVLTHAMDVGALTPFLWGFEEREKLMVRNLGVTANMVYGLNSNNTDYMAHRNSTSVSPVLVYTLPMLDQVASTKIYQLAYSTTSTNGPPSLATVSTRPRKCLQITESGSPV